MANPRRALITGINGQDGVYLTRHLRGLGYDVVGTGISLDRASDIIAAYLPDVPIVEADIRDSEALGSLIEQTRPDEIYNLAGRSSVRESWDAPIGSTEVNAMAVLGLLEQVRALREPGIYEPRLLQAASSEMFGLAYSFPQGVHSAHHPRSPYASAKSFAFHSTMNYRESYGMFAVNAVLFNHESPIRPEQFVTRKIARAAAEIATGNRETVDLGNLDVRRDWGAAADYVVAMHLMLQADEPRDFVIATGRSHSLLDFLGAAMRAAGVDDWRDRITIDPALARPADVPETRGDPDPIRQRLGWEATTGFTEVVATMVDVELRRIDTDVMEDPAYL